jgi:hypothetical protein
MALITFLLWIVSLVLLALAAFFPFGQYNLLAAGLFVMDLWLGLQWTVETTDPITF